MERGHVLKYIEGNSFNSTGRVQADFCGQRLKAMGLPFTKMVSSTLARAVDTADIFHRYLPGLPWQQDPILCEGIPVPPEPAVGRWKPEKQALSTNYFASTSSDLYYFNLIFLFLVFSLPNLPWATYLCLFGNLGLWRFTICGTRS